MILFSPYDADSSLCSDSQASLATINTLCMYITTMPVYTRLSGGELFWPHPREIPSEDSFAMYNMASGTTVSLRPQGTRNERAPLNAGWVPSCPHGEDINQNVRGYIRVPLSAKSRYLYDVPGTQDSSADNNSSSRGHGIKFISITFYLQRRQADHKIGEAPTNVQWTAFMAFTLTQSFARPRLL